MEKENNFNIPGKLFLEEFEYTYKDELVDNDYPIVVVIDMIVKLF